MADWFLEARRRFCAWPRKIARRKPSAPGCVWIRGAALLLFCAHPAWALAGIVETLDGKTIEGRLHLGAAGVRVISSNAERIEINLTNLLRADFSMATNASASPDGASFGQDASHREDGALPAPWRSASIGSAERRGGAGQVDGVFTLEAVPRPRKMRGESLHFVYQTWDGDGEIVARVVSLQPRGAKGKPARAGVMMRAGLEPESANVSLSLSGGLGSLFRRWSRKGEKVVGDQRPEIKPPYWVKLARENGQIAGYLSTDGQSWKLAASSATDLPTRMFVGLAVLSRRDTIAAAALDRVSIRSTVPRAQFTPRVVLRDGTVIADHFVAMDETGITFSQEKRPLKVLTADVARLLFQPVFEASSLTPGRTGLLLSNGDFIDGEFRGLEGGWVKINSVLLGQRSYELNRRVAAVILRRVSPRMAPFEITTSDGSVWHPASLTVQEETLHVEEPLAGAREIPVPELLEIRRNATR